MTVVLIFIGVIAGILILAAGMCGLAVWASNSMTDCSHSYERVDTCNDKKMIFVCRKCGKIVKLRK